MILLRNSPMRNISLYLLCQFYSLTVMSVIVQQKLNKSTKIGWRMCQ